MGSSLCVTVGYGINLPWGDEDDFDFTTNSFFDPFYDTEPDDRDEWDRPDTYEALESICKQFPLLAFDTAYYSDYTGGAALLVKSTVKVGYGAAVTEFDPAPTEPYPKGVAQLQAAAAVLGITAAPTWLVVVSYG